MTRRAPRDRGPSPRLARFAIAGLVGVAALLAASSVLVTAGDALVVSRFGDPVRVLIEPGLRWKLPPPFETVLPVDLRLKTTSSGLQDVGTKDGLRILVEAYVAWRVEADPDHVRQYLRAVRNQPNEAASQIRTFLGSALETTVSSFELASLVNTDPGRVEIAALEDRLAAQLDKQLLDTYGISVQQLGIERLDASDPSARRHRVAHGGRADDGGCRANGGRPAQGRRDHLRRRARRAHPPRQCERGGGRHRSQVREEAAGIYSKAFNTDPKLYTLLRSLDTLDRISNPNTRIFLRTDAAPFRVLIDGPQTQGWSLNPAPPQ